MQNQQPSAQPSESSERACALGAELELFGPLGQATFRPEEEHDLLCIAGGSGIAGLMSILDHAVSVNHFARHRGRLFFGVRTLADGFYLQELAALVAKADGALEVTLVLSDEAAPSTTHPDFPELWLAEGFVHEAAARMIDGPSDNTLGFVAGPPPMVDGAIRVLLTEARLTPGRIRYDKFS